MSAKHEIIICLGSSCFSRGNRDTLKIVEKYLKDNNLKDSVDFRGKLCSGNCGLGPIIFLDRKMYEGVKSESVKEILDELFKK
jgi:NADH:ubiquinone oxidoreductase subunit E